MPAFDGRGAQRQPRRLVKARMGTLVQHRHGRVRKRDCWLTKKTMHGCTTLQLRWAIVHIYQIEGLRGWAAIGRRFQELFPGACRGVGSKRNTCQRVVQLWLRTGHVCPGFFKSEGDRGGGPKITAAALDFIALHAKANPAMYVRHDLVPAAEGGARRSRRQAGHQTGGYVGTQQRLQRLVAQVWLHRVTSAVAEPSHARAPLVH